MSALCASKHTISCVSYTPCQCHLFIVGRRAKMFVQTFVSLRLDYCNYLLIETADDLMRRLQAVQNAAARLITGTRRRDHIAPILRQLHWLPVRQRVEFKLVRHLSKPTWFSSTVPVRLLSTRHCLRSTSTTIVRSQYVRHSTHLHSCRRSLLRCRRTTSVEQSPCWTSPPQPFYHTVP